MHRPRTHSPANWPLRSGGGPSSLSVTPHSTAPALPNTKGKALVGREASADAPGGARNVVKGAPAEKAKRRPKKKGWKGWAMVYYDDDGNVIEERPRDETPPDDRFMTPLLPEERQSRGSSSVVRPTEAAPAEHTEPQKADVFAQPKKRRKTSPGSTGQPETSRANSTAPRPLPSQPKTPHPSNPSPSTGRTLAVTAATGEWERGASSSCTTKIHVVEDHPPLKILRVGIPPRNPNPERVDSDLQRPNQSPPHRRTEPESTAAASVAASPAETSRTADPRHAAETKSEGEKRLEGSELMGTQEDEQRPTSRATVSGEHGEQERHLPLRQARRPIIPKLSPEFTSEISPSQIADPPDTPRHRIEPGSTLGAPQTETSRTVEDKKRLLGSGEVGMQVDEKRPPSRTRVSRETGEQEQQLSLLVRQTRRPIPMMPPEPASGPLSSPFTIATSSSPIAPLEVSPGGQSDKKQFSEDATRLGGGGEVDQMGQEREELRAAKTALSEEILELRRANLLLLETVKEGSAIAVGLTEDLQSVRREKEEEKDRTEMLSQENVDLRRKALDHKRVRREAESKLEAANNEIGVLKGRLDEMARQAAREREALDKAWQRKLDEAEVLARIAIKEARHSGTTGVAEELAAIAFSGHIKPWVPGE
ncbi:hypothetical protein JCM24511_07321 [Saitozyma sp. JCM 24511]|nr:hypothetical protein JCM24511_07321 [Saitozyma sp. JCM 24511]